MKNSFNFDLEKIKYLSRYVIGFGIFEKSNIEEKVKVLNTDETTTEVYMKISDILYFSEMGTMTIPGRHILEKSLHFCSELIETHLSVITDMILIKDITFEEIDSELENLRIRLENYVKGIFISEISNINKLGSLSNDENQYLFDLKRLSKYIECKLFLKKSYT